MENNNMSKSDELRKKWFCQHEINTLPEGILIKSTGVCKPQFTLFLPKEYLINMAICVNRINGLDGKAAITQLIKSLVDIQSKDQKDCFFYVCEGCGFVASVYEMKVFQNHYDKDCFVCGSDGVPEISISMASNKDLYDKLRIIRECK